VSEAGGSIADVAPHLEADPEQQRVLQHREGSLLVTGAAGTGKTAVLRERFAHLIERGADPERIALVVRSRREREQAREALHARLPMALPDLRVFTVHALAFHVMEARGVVLGYAHPPDVLSAADQFARVRELLAGEDHTVWNAYGGLLELRGFADQVRQLLLRAQEALLQPDEMTERAERAGLPGWQELADFYRRYLDVLDDLGVVDYAGLVSRAARAASESAQPLFDHVLVDDYQDSTLATEALIAGLRAGDLVVAGDLDSHVFAFQGKTDRPLERFVETFGASAIELTVRYRGVGVELRAWSADHTSEEHAAAARELRRTHVEDGVPWNRMAVVVRRQGNHLASVLRALDDAEIPRATPEIGMSLLAEPAAHPYVLALRWLARPDERDTLAEPILTSDLVRLAPARAQALIRAAHAEGQPPATSLIHEEGLQPSEVADLAALRSTLERAQPLADRSVADAFSLLWRELPLSRRLVDAGADTWRDLDAVVALSRAIVDVGEQADASVAAFLDWLEAGEDGPGVTGSPGRTPEAVSVLTAHGAAGREFDTVLVIGAVEGDFPSLSRPEPMFDLEVLEERITRSERTRRRLIDERRLFRTVVSRASRRVLFLAGDPHGDQLDLSVRSRFVAELGVDWEPSPTPTSAEPLTVAEATAAWRRALADHGSTPSDRLAALEGLRALGDDPRRWWFQLDWTDTGRPLHEHVRVSYSKLDTLENCELQFLLGEELGLDTRRGYHAWVGHLVHKLIEDCENGDVDRDLGALVAEAEARWRSQEFPSLAVSEAFRRAVTKTMLPAWFREYGQAEAAEREVHFEFDLEGAVVSGYIDRIGDVSGGGSQITDYKTGSSRNATPADDNLQLGTYFLAVERAPELTQYRPVKAVELAFLKDRDRGGEMARKVKGFSNPQQAAGYGQVMLERLSGLVTRVQELLGAEHYRPNPAATCRYCAFTPLCPLYPEGQTLFSEGSAT
jgi:superfamily I DNA/RNA helicase/RecB family exonuclease